MADHFLIYQREREGCWETLQSVERRESYREQHHAGIKSDDYIKAVHSEFTLENALRCLEDLVNE